MKYIKFFENYNKDITQIINNLIIEYDDTPYNIDDGMCDEFASDIIDRMGGYTDNLYEISGDMFFNYRDPEFAKENWSEIIETTNGVWSKKLLDYWGYPPKDIQEIYDEINHVWVYYNGKHYDAEAPNGVKKWYDLPLIKKHMNI